MVFSHRYFRTKMLTYVTLGVYLYALVILPALHVHDDTHHHDNDTAAVEAVHEAEANCGLCQFIHLTVPLCEAPELFSVTEKIFRQPPAANPSFPVTFVIGLPPSRAPPLV
jgi:hypothetical protein